MQPKVDVAESPAGATVDRIVAFVCLTAGAGMTYVLALARPDSRGFGTHEQLGMSPCSWPVTMEAPCPTCGFTTAACHLVHLSPIRAILTQPFGAAMAAAGLAAAAYAGFCLLTGRSFLDRIARLPCGTIAAWSLALFFSSWLYAYLTFDP